MVFMGMGLGMFGFIVMKVIVLIVFGMFIVFEGCMLFVLYWVGVGLGGIVMYGMWKMNIIGFFLFEKFKDVREFYVVGFMVIYVELLKVNLC